MGAFIKIGESHPNENHENIELDNISSSKLEVTKLRQVTVEVLSESLNKLLEQNNLNYEKDKLNIPKVEKCATALLLSAAFKGEDKVLSDILHIEEMSAAYQMKCMDLNALHIAIIQGHPSCVKIILSLEERDLWMEELTLEKNSPLHVAALRKRTKSATLLIKNGASLSALNHNKEMALSLVSSHVPGALSAIEPMLDSYITLKDENNTEVVNVQLKRFQKSTSIGSKLTIRKLHAANYGFSMLSCFDTCKQTKFLNHPLCQLILEQNWICVKNLFYTRLAMCLILLLSMTTYIMVFHVFDCEKSIPAEFTSFFSCNGTSPRWILSLQDSSTFQAYIAIVYYILVPLIFLDILRKMTGLMSITKSRFTPQGKRMLLHYFQQFDNWFEWISACGILYLFFQPPAEDSWHKILAPLVTVVSWANFMHLVGQLAWFGVYVEMYITVLKIFIELFSVYSILIIGYSLSFYMFFKEEGSFSDPLRAMWKTLAMMIGDLEYNDMFRATNFNSFSTVHIVYITFLLTTSVVLMNLLIGIVVHDVNEIKKAALETKLVRTLRLVLYLDTSSRSLKKIFCISEGSNYLCKESNCQKATLVLKVGDHLYDEAREIALKAQGNKADVAEGTSCDDIDLEKIISKAKEMQSVVTEFFQLLGQEVRVPNTPHVKNNENKIF